MLKHNQQLEFLPFQ